MRGIVAYVLAKKFAKNYTDTKIDTLPTGFHIKEAVATSDDLPSTGNNAGDVRETLDDGKFYFWDGDEFQPFHLAITIDEELNEHSTNALQNKTITQELADRQMKDEDAEIGEVAIFGADGSTVSSGASIVDSSFIDDPTDDTTIPTTKYVGDKMDDLADVKQDKYVNVGSSTTVFVDSQEVPELNKIQFLTAYNAFIAGKTVLILDTLHNDAYVVNQSSSRTYDATTELRFSINAHNSTFVDYVYDDATDEVTVESTFSAVSTSDKTYWDGKADKNTITRTTSTEVTLTSGDTTVITSQVQMVAISFELPDDVDEDFITSLILKPYQNFMFRYEEPEGYALTWGSEGVPDFESGSIYELSFKLIGMQDPSGNELIVGKWSKI